MSSLSSVLSLNRLKNQKLHEGESFQAAGRLESYSASLLTLKGQEEARSFALNEKTYLCFQGQKIFPVQWKKYLFKNQCVVLKIKNHHNFQIVSSIQILTNSQREPKEFYAEPFKLWHSFIREVENFFLSAGLCPVQTPSLVPCPGTEAHLRFFSTQRKNNGAQEKLWLASSPEIHLKKFLCRNATDIFEIHKCYRNEEQGSLNWNEFYMLEWYRAYADLNRLIQDLECLLAFLKKKNLIAPPLLPIQKFSVRELFKKHCGISLTPESCAEDFHPLLKKYNIPFSFDHSFEDLFHLVFLNLIESKLDAQAPVVVYDYPPSLRAYSKLTLENWADRFELYWRGMELANAFNEITDPELQRSIFKKDIHLHTEDQLNIDEEFMDEMKAGFPPTAGIALGLERLFTAAQGLKKFPLY